METTILAMSMDDYGEAFALWQVSEGIGLSAADGPAEMARFLEHNPGLSFVARAEGRLVGTLLGSSDGRRGYLHHLAVQPGFRRRGTGRALVEHTLGALAERGILKCHLFVHAHNQAGKLFWQRLGFSLRSDIEIMSRNI